MRRSLVLAALLFTLWPGSGLAQQLSLQVESEEIYANLPFVLTVVAKGFEEQPQPRLGTLQIPGCKVTPLGVTPHVSNMVQIVNGQRSEFREVTFAYRFRVEASRPGTYQIPALTAEQGQKRAQVRPASFQVRSIEDTRDMQVRLQLPERPVWIGETFDATLEWYLRKDVRSRNFVVPLLDMDDWVEVEAAPGGQDRLPGFHAGAKELELPYQRDTATLDGVSYTRFRFLLRITPIKAGTLSAPPPRVVAGLQTGVGQDAFGFPTPVMALFQAVGKPVRLEVRAPPLTGRPESFRNAIGSAFSIEVQAPRTVVRVGDPIELRILLRGRGRLQGLMLPDLHAAGLPPADFTVPKDIAPGEITEDGKGKLFSVSVRLRSAAARQIPALSFSYFDPDKGAFQTARSQPIALSVQGSAVVGAADVVDAAAPKVQAARPQREAAPGGPEPALSAAGADLALSAEGATLRRVRSVREIVPLLLFLYVAPLGLLLFRLQRRRTSAVRARRGETDAARAALLRSLEEAAAQPAREAAPKVAAALRTLQRRMGKEAEGQPLLDRIETEAYSPQAAQAPLDAALRERIRDQALRWLVVALVLLSAARGYALTEGALPEARRSYKEALEQKDPDRRREGFLRAEALYRELAAAQPDRPELLSDWGSAALLAQEPGRAVLAYRRALRLDPGLLRARRDLAFVREHLPEWLPRVQESGVVDTLFFWHHALSGAQRHLLMALGFAGAALLCGARRRRWLALLPGLLAVAMGLSLWVEQDHDAAAVVMLPGLLRTADSSGAPPALGRPLSAGAEVRLREQRGEWAQVELADGQRGWLQSSAVERVGP